MLRGCNNNNRVTILHKLTIQRMAAEALPITDLHGRQRDGEMEGPGEGWEGVKRSVKRKCQKSKHPAVVE